MGKILPFRKRRRSSRWLRPETYHSEAKIGQKAKRGIGWFPLALVTIPLAAFGAVLLWPSADGVDAGGGVAGPAESERANFALCSGPVRVTCVVDGDTIWYQAEKIRIADIDTPEVTKPGCANEAAMGRKATLRLQALLNEGPFSFEPNPDGRSTDDYGRSLLLVTRGGESLGAVLVDEGLAEQWGGPRRDWC
jgi:micrococcal nuclease